MPKRTLKKSLTALLIIILAGAAVLIIIARPPLWVFIFLAADALLLGVIVYFHAKTTQYRCPACGLLFKISPFTDFSSPHMPGKKLLQCPSCTQTNRCPTTYPPLTPDLTKHRRPVDLIHPRVQSQLSRVLQKLPR